MDFFRIYTKHLRDRSLEIGPEFLSARTKDCMVRGRAFYAVWDEEAGLWTTDWYRTLEIVDSEVLAAYESLKRKGVEATVKLMREFDSGRVERFNKWCASIGDNHHPLDRNFAWSNTEVKRTDYISRRLPYALEEGDFSSWDELMSVLYAPEERAKLEWAIGALVAGDAKNIQKFIVLYGASGTGKSTVLNIIQKLFAGGYVAFDAKDIGNSTKDFALEMFKHNPLVAIQHDGDLSKLNDNTKLNSIIAHEEMLVNEKYKSAYAMKFDAFLFMGTNSEVKITDRNSGIIRRLIDVEPTGNRLRTNHYNTLMSRIDFELGAIAWHCREVYWAMGKNYYEDYIPTKMLLKSNIIYNFIEYNFDILKSQDGGTLKQIYAMYKEYCLDTGIERYLPMYRFRSEIEPYFHEFHDRFALDDGSRVRSYFHGFKGLGAFKKTTEEPGVFRLVLDETTSVFDEMAATYTAQYANEDGIPKKRWAYVKTTLGDIDTRQSHYVKVPENHIVIDFDLRGPRGGKDLELNLEAASAWPATYAEISHGGSGVHLHYLYDGDPSQLSNVYSEGIEIKVYTGNSALRRKLTKCNSIPVSTLSNGLPLKEKKVLPANTIKSEKGLRDLIGRNLRKEIHPGTKPSIDFIKKILDEAYDSDTQYNVEDMRQAIIQFAASSTNKATECLRMVQQMKFHSEEIPQVAARDEDSSIVFFDVEVFPNLFVICWKYEGSDTVARMINPTPQDVEALFSYKLVGFNNRRYDNHILYARYMGYDNEALYKLSDKIINSQGNTALFGEAYNLSYTDIYDFSSKKQSLKKFGIELGLHHVEVDIPWDQPVPDELVSKVVEYCVNDVLLTQAVFENRYQDFVARQILADLSGLSVNSSTQQHTARIIFGDDKKAKDHFIYTDLSQEFPGYVFDSGVSTYRDEIVGEGGYVYAEPGIYENVTVLDVASMHPTSIEVLDLFGPYTRNFSALKDARLAIKHRDYKAASKMLDGKLAPYLKDESQAEALSYALKIVINIVYGLTSAKFDNPFRDNRNKDNIVAKRGALFMIDLKHAVQEQGRQVVHIKTDSIKIPNADPGIIDFIVDFGRKYGYEFELEAVYDRFCLANDAVYIAREGAGNWTAVGAQFQHPYVFKTLFSGEPIEFEDLCEPRSVQKGAMYLDFEHDRPMVLIEGMHFVGRTGLFVPVKTNGGVLYRVQDGKHYAVTGTKNYLWVEAEMARLGMSPDDIDMNYFERLADEAVDTINKFGSFAEFTR